MGAPRQKRQLTAQDKIHLEQVFNGLNRGYLKPHGVHPTIRHALAEYGERFIFKRVDYDLEKQMAPPPEVEAAMLDVFGPDRIFDSAGRRRLMVRMHPQLNRWCFWERRIDPTKGENYWKVIFVHQEEPIDGELPHDILELHATKQMFVAHLFGTDDGGGIGKYRLPNKEDFIRIEATDVRRHGHKKVDEHFTQQEEAPKLEAEYHQTQLEEELVDMSWEFERDKANQEAGSGQRMTSYPTVAERENPERWSIEERNGYRVRTPKSREVREDEKVILIADALEARRKKIWEEIGLNRNPANTSASPVSEDEGPASAGSHASPKDQAAIRRIQQGQEVG